MMDNVVNILTKKLNKMINDRDALEGAVVNLKQQVIEYEEQITDTNKLITEIETALTKLTKE